MGVLRFLTAGESHGQCLTAIVEGIPSGLAINVEEMNKDMVRRQQGYGRGDRMKIETDQVEILSGVRFGETIGDPITLRVKNRDWENWKDRMSVSGEMVGSLVTAARPGHADLIGTKKYNRKDIRDILERASARETATRVAVGALSKQFLKSCGIMVISRVTNIGGLIIDKVSVGADAMKAKIHAAKEEGDTLGGIFEVVVKGAPLGLGSHIQWDRRLDARLSGAMMSIQAIKGVEIGAGFEYANLPGSLAHDEMFFDEAQNVYRKTNHAGGIEGGMSNGEEIVVRAVMKPIPTLMKPLHSIDIESKKEVLACRERSDVCAVSAAAVVGEAMIAFVIAEALLEKFGGDCMADVTAGMNSYSKRIQGE